MSCSSRNVYFVEDPFWDLASGLSNFQMREMALRQGKLLHIGNFADWEAARTWAEGHLAEGGKVIFSPFWWRSMEDSKLSFEQGQAIILDVISSDEKVQAVLSKTEDGFRQLGYISAEYVKRRPEREQVYALFYRGLNYDRYYEAFTSSFRQTNPDPNSLVVERFYSAEVQDLARVVEKIPVNRSLIVIAMAQLSSVVFNRLDTESNSLLIVEGHGPEPDVRNRILASLDSDYKTLYQKALELKPEDGSPIEIPSLLRLYQPERLSDIPNIEADLERGRIAEKVQKTRISSRWQEFLQSSDELFSRISGYLDSLRQPFSW